MKVLCGLCSLWNTKMNIFWGGRWGNVPSSSKREFYCEVSQQVCLPLSLQGNRQRGRLSNSRRKDTEIALSSQRTTRSPGTEGIGEVKLLVANASKLSKQLQICQGSFPKGSKRFLYPESHSKILKCLITELFYSRILNMNRGSLYANCFRHIHLSKYELTNGFTSPKGFQGFRETGPRSNQTDKIPNSKLEILF